MKIIKDDLLKYVSNDRIHVISNNNKWSVKREGASRTYRVYGKKNEAIKVGKSLAEAKGSELVVHARDGSVSERYIYKVK